MKILYLIHQQKEKLPFPVESGTNFSLTMESSDSKIRFEELLRNSRQEWEKDLEVSNRKQEKIKNTNDSSNDTHDTKQEKQIEQKQWQENLSDKKSDKKIDETRIDKQSKKEKKQHPEKGGEQENQQVQIPETLQKKSKKSKEKDQKSSHILVSSLETDFLKDKKILKKIQKENIISSRESLLGKQKENWNPGLYNKKGFITNHDAIHHKNKTLITANGFQEEFQKKIKFAGGKSKKLSTEEILLDSRELLLKNKKEKKEKLELPLLSQKQINTKQEKEIINSIIRINSKEHSIPNTSIPEKEFLNSDSKIEILVKQNGKESQSNQGKSSFESHSQYKNESSEDMKAFSHFQNINRNKEIYNTKEMSFSDSIKETIREAMEELISKARVQLGKNQFSAQIRLNPSIFGYMSVNMKLENNSLILKILVDNQEILKKLQESMDWIKHEFSKHGIQVENIQVRFKDTSSHSFSDSNAFLQNSNSQSKQSLYYEQNANDSFPYITTKESSKSQAEKFSIEEDRIPSHSTIEEDESLFLYHDQRKTNRAMKKLNIWG